MQDTAQQALGIGGEWGGQETPLWSTEQRRLWGVLGASDWPVSPPPQDNASKLLLALMESRHDSENAERILISLRPQELVSQGRWAGHCWGVWAWG